MPYAVNNNPPAQVQPHWMTAFNRAPVAGCGQFAGHDVDQRPCLLPHYLRGPGHDDLAQVGGCR